MLFSSKSEKPEKIKMTYWMLDVTFQDDRNTSMAKTGAKNLPDSDQRGNNL